jgi:hypothetical protein
MAHREEIPAGSAIALLAELDSTIAEGRKGDIFGAVAFALDALYRMSGSDARPHRGDGAQALSMFHLTTRSLSDLIASAHLASHAYLQQAYTLLWPVMENGDLIELFYREPAEARVWLDAPKPGKLFRPADVRKRVQAPLEDGDVYGYLSELGTHPRAPGLRIASVYQQSDQGLLERVEARVGPFMLSDPATVMVFVWIFQVLVRFAGKLRRMSVVDSTYSDEAWSTAFLATVLAAMRGSKLARAELLDLGYQADSERLDDMYDGLFSQIVEYRRAAGYRTPGWVVLGGEPLPDSGSSQDQSR